MEFKASIPVQLPHPSPLPSYWHDPKSPLASHRHADTLPKEADYVIIGSGITGTMIAYNLLNKSSDSDIVMLEAREACGGATGRNGGHTKAASYRTYLHHKKELGKDEALKIAALEYENILATHALAAKENIDCENRLCNTVDIIYDRETFEQGKKAVETLKEDAGPEQAKKGGLADYEVWNKQEAMQRYCVGHENQNPEVQEKEQVVGAFEYLAGRLSAYKFSTGLLKKCADRGLKLWTNTPVTKMSPSASHAKTQWEVQTPHGTVLAQNIVLATNGYTAHLLPSIRGRIVPMRGQITTHQPPQSTKLPTPLPTTYSFIYKTGYEYMIPRPICSGQHMVIGGGLGRQKNAGASEYGTCDDSALNDDISLYLKNSLIGYFGRENWGKAEAEAERIVQEWTGIMGATADGLPYVGGVPGMRGVWMAAGFNGHGMVLCLKSAEALGHLITGGELKSINWFPESFMITEERLKEGSFHGRMDMSVDGAG